MQLSAMQLSAIILFFFIRFEFNIFLKISVFLNTGMEIFTYLTNGVDSVFHTYDTKEKLKNKFIIRNELLNKFIVFPCYKDYEIYFQESPNHEKCFHEVIIGSNLQKIKFDIDIEIENASKGANEDANASEYTNEIIIANINVIIDTIIE